MSAQPQTSHSLTPKSSQSNRPLVQCAISPRTILCNPDDTIKVTVFADMLRAKITRAVVPGDELRRQQNKPAPRGKITEFSRKSRKRMIEAIAQKREHIRPLFVTLTYPDEIWFDLWMDGRDLNDHLQSFIERLKRAFPEAGMMWRKEAETRKSGLNKGKVAPHLHLIIDGLLHDVAWIRQEFSRWWTEIIRAGQLKKAVRVDVQVAKSRRHSYYYVSKYVSKVGHANVKKSKFLEENEGKFGRHWGVCGHWDRTPVLILHISYEEFVKLRRLVSRWLKSRKNHYARTIARGVANCGFSVFGLGDVLPQGVNLLTESTAWLMVEAILFSH